MATVSSRKKFQLSNTKFEGPVFLKHLTFLTYNTASVDFNFSLWCSDILQLVPNSIFQILLFNPLLPVTNQAAPLSECFGMPGQQWPTDQRTKNPLSNNCSSNQSLTRVFKSSWHVHSRFKTSGLRLRHQVFKTCQNVPFYLFVMSCISPYWYKQKGHQVRIQGEWFREIYDTTASKENLSTGKYFVKLLDVLLRWADTNENFEVLQTPHITALALPYCKQNK